MAGVLFTENRIMNDIKGGSATNYSMRVCARCLSSNHGRVYPSFSDPGTLLIVQDCIPI